MRATTTSVLLCRGWHGRKNEWPFPIFESSFCAISSWVVRLGGGEAAAIILWCLMSRSTWFVLYDCFDNKAAEYISRAVVVGGVRRRRRRRSQGHKKGVCCSWKSPRHTILNLYGALIVSYLEWPFHNLMVIRSILNDFIFMQKGVESRWVVDGLPKGITVQYTKRAIIILTSLVLRTSGPSSFSIL